MGATRIEFRLRMAIMIVIVTLGFWAPWIEPWGSSYEFAQRIPLLEWLPLQLTRLGLLPFSIASPVVIVIGILFAAVGAILRIWGAAYLGSFTVHHGQMQASTVMTAGPFRYMRNPLYLGGWCMMVATSLIMPTTGAMFSTTLLTVFFLRLILGEETFLAGQFGAPYKAYLKEVPRFIPRFRTALPSAHGKPQWLLAFITEINPIGIFFILAFLSWSYNNWLMIKAVLISLGLSLVARAFAPVAQASPNASE